MAAYKTGLPEYRDGNGKSVFAAQITGIEEMDAKFRGARILHLGHRQTCVIPDFVSRWHPEVGGWFITHDTEDNRVNGYYESAQSFIEKYTEVKNG